MSAQSRSDVNRIVNKNLPVLRSFGVRRCALFGSFLHDKMTPQSDVDLLVEFEPDQKTFLNLVNLSFFLEEILGRRVEIVTPESLSPHMGPDILDEAEYVVGGR